MFTRPVVITLAIAGGACSVAAGALRKRAGQDASEVREPWKAWAAQLDMAGYLLMGISMLCFIVAGLRGTES